MYASKTQPQTTGDIGGETTIGMSMPRPGSDGWLQQTENLPNDHCFNHRYYPLAHKPMANQIYHTQLQQHMNPVAIAPHPNHQQLFHQEQQQQQQMPQPPLHQPAHMPRKRPKYSRSKQGCLSCRVRKVKCDETRPICTRCAHSQRECTWPSEMPKSKKGSQSASDSVPTSRPSTSSGAPGATSDSDWQSDSGAAGPIRGLARAHGRASATHSRNSSVNSIRGRDLGMASSANVSRNASANHSRSRDRSPDPFAFTVNQLGSLTGHHQRSTSTSSAASNSSVSSLPYPLVAQPGSSTISSMSIPGLSTSQTSSPASGAFVQSPTMAWPPATSDNIYGPRPGTSSGIVAGLENIDINNLNASAFGVGLDASGFPNGGFAYNAALDSSSGFSNSQNFDPTSYSNFDTSLGNGFDTASTFIPGLDLDPESFLAQLQQSLGSEGVNLAQTFSDPSISSSSSSNSPDMDMESLVGSMDPRAMAGSVAGYDQRHPGYGGGGSGTIPMFGSSPAVPTAMTGFREAQTPMAALGFGLPPLTPPRNQMEASPYGMKLPQGQASGFGGINSIPELGTSRDPPARHPLQQPDSLSMGEFGATTSTSSPMSMHYLPASTMTQSPTTMGSTPSGPGLSSSQMPMIMTSNTAFGSTSGGIPPPHHPSDRSDSNSSPGARLPTGPSRVPQEYSPRVEGTGAGRFTDEARAGAPEPISSQVLMKQTMRMTNGRELGQGGSALDLFPSASLPTAGSRSAEAEREQLHSDTPKPSFQQQQRQHRANQQRQRTITEMDLQFDSLSQSPLKIFSQSQPPQQAQQSQQYLLSQKSLYSQRAVNHARSRSDTITPQNALSPTRSNSMDDTSSPFSKSSASSQWSQGLHGLAGAMGTAFQNGSSGESAVGARSGQWGTLSPQTLHVMMNPDPLEPFFKTVQERNLIRHYCQTSTKLMMALPSSLNPILSIHLPIILSSPATSPMTPPPSLVSPPTSPDVSEQYDSGMMQPSLVDQRNAMLSPLSSQSLHASIEALRLSLLGVASIHQSYLLTKSGPENRDRAMEMWNLAGRLRLMASKCLGDAVTNIEGCRSDASLAACVSIALIDIFSGGYNYSQNMELAKTLVVLRGGPAAIVRYSAASVKGEAISPSFEGPLHFVEAGGSSPPDGNHKKRRGVLISSARLLLEILTVYEVFSTLTSGQQPSLLRPGDSHWWFEGDKSNYHLFSVENMFGMSRSIVELFARVSSFLNRHRHPASSDSRLTVQGHPTPNPSRPSTPTPSLSGLHEVPPPPGSPLAPLHAEAFAFLREVEAWNDSMLPMAAMHPRVRYGNYAHKSALLILLLREAFNLPPNDPRVQKCAELTLLAALKASADFVMSVDLTWPVIIAGCQSSGALRVLTMRALEGFRKQCCFEIDTSELIVNEVWRRMDASEPRADFRGVVEDHNLNVLIL